MAGHQLDERSQNISIEDKYHFHVARARVSWEDEIRRNHRRQGRKKAMKRSIESAIPRKSGFTLIELLIVIAIILILIAIALPNFLEAQIRAKTTKCNAEMRGIAQALESYRTDWPRYPPQATYETTQFNPIFPAISNNVWSLMQLTTPLRYMERVPLDIFAPQGDEMLVNGTTGDRITPHPGDQAHGLTYFYWSQEGLRTSRQFDTADAMKHNGINYVLLSVAPDRDLDAINLKPEIAVQLRINAVHWSYSPTNGTKSSGDIVRTTP
jgi:general secretion pathway protein G